MTEPTLPDDLVVREGSTRIALVVLDGLGGLPHPGTGLTELETARTPRLDSLAAESSLGMLVPVAPGITPGSGPAHLALFGYDPVRFVVGRGALSALGVGFGLERGDLAVRLNLATLDADGRVTDRRAGRPADAEARRVVERLRSGIQAGDGVEIFLLHEKEHRAVLVLRGPDLDDRINDTDPQRTGVPPEEPSALAPEAERAAGIVRGLLEQARGILAEEERITGVLARGFALHAGFPGFEERYGLRCAAYAAYPMYRGVARLVGMSVPDTPADDDAAVGLLQAGFDDHDFHFLHVKAPDARGEDGDFEAKARAIEQADALVARVAALEPDVLVVTGDHSTPAALRAHSWHPVPVLLRSRWARPTGSAFGETACRGGDLGIFPSRHLMSLVLAHAGRLEKFGA